MNQSDEILAARIARHDFAAFEIMYDRFASRVISLAAMLLDCAEAERIVLQVFSQLWFEIDQFITNGGSFQDWLLGLARTHIMIKLHDHEGQTVQDVVDALSRWLSDAANHKVKDSEKWHQPSSRIPVWQALQNLPLEQQCVIALAGYGGFKQKEIAQLLSLPLSAVEQHIRKGLPRLRDLVISQPVLERV